MENPTFPLGPLGQDCLLSTSESLLEWVPLSPKPTAKREAGPGPGPGPDISLANQDQTSPGWESKKGEMNLGKAATEQLPRGGRFLPELLRSLKNRILKSRGEKGASD